ncbi:membrane protein [Campylobacter lari]|uniref:Uncharacterized protein n=1 Tax=Campylobacter lari NCTC 11845 TaxID=1388749 RepID=A0A0A8HZD4_CAMLA|nr:hypothetical protein [Campylobacter lari]AJD02165.1 hypothetical protein UPTC3659_1332 [Campylobacter lari NCTC 11845]EAK0848466.1 hypothetical protein [Campylobacter lari]EAK0980405.1 hypothetical protein [Campylobacter lari]EAK9955211.1 hypothetical protein [Campylobacter lari]MCR6543819.1 hypothetical protein [Campylobacter lari]
MNNSLFIFLIIALVVVIILGILLVLFFTHKDKQPNKTSTIKATQISNIEDFISKANGAKNSQEIQALILQFLNSQKFGSNPKDSATKRKLDFISAISANANATPKNISFLNNELKKRYKALKKEIDAYEQIGLAKRKMRQS